MSNLIWPRVLARKVGAGGVIGRSIHWLGVALAAALLVTALGWAADGWSWPMAAALAAAAAATALGGRGVRYLLARE